MAVRIDSTDSTPPPRPKPPAPPQTPAEMRYISVASYRRNDKMPAMAHVGTRPNSQVKFFPVCGRLLAGAVSESARLPRDRRVCPACSSQFVKEFGKPPPPEFKK